MKRLLVALGIVVGLVAAILLIAPAVIPVDAYQHRLIAAVKAATGRDLRINGAMRLAIVPSLAVEASDVAFSNTPGGRATNMAQLKALRVELKWLPLLRGEIVVDHFDLVEPVIALEIDKDGHPNWIFASRKETARPAPNPGGASDTPRHGGAEVALRLDDVRVDDGALSFSDQRTGKQETVTGITVKFSLPGRDSPFVVNGTAVWNGEPVSLDLTVANPTALETGAESTVMLKLVAAPITLAFDGRVKGTTADAVGGTIDINVPSLRNLATWAGAPITMSGTGLGPLMVKGGVTAGDGTIAVSNASISLDAIKATGDLTVVNGDQRPHLSGRLDVERLDLNPYLPTESPRAGTGLSASPGSTASALRPSVTTAGWSDSPLDLAALKAVDADLDLATGPLVYRRIEVGRSRLKIALKDGRLSADLADLALYEGSGKGSITVDGAADEPTLAADFHFTNVTVEPLLQDAANMDRLSGNGGVDLTLTGHGKSERELIASLNGKGALNLAKGAFKGVDLIALIRHAATAIVSAGSSGGLGTETDFSSLTGTFTIAGGILRNNDLKMVSPEIPLDGAGTIDLPRRSVDYKVTPRLAGALAIPVFIRGPWDNISYEPDLAGIVADPAKAVGGVLSSGARGVGGAASGVGKDLGAPLKGLFGQ